MMEKYKPQNGLVLKLEYTIDGGETIETIKNCGLDLAIDMLDRAKHRMREKGLKEHGNE